MKDVFLEIDLYLSNISVVWTWFWATRKIMYALKLCYSLCMCSCILSHFSHCWLFATPWTVAHQAPLAVGFCRQEYWSGLPCPPPGDLPDPGIESTSPALQEDSLPTEPPGKPHDIAYLAKEKKKNGQRMEKVIGSPKIISYTVYPSYSKSLQELCVEELTPLPPAFKNKL